MDIDIYGYENGDGSPVIHYDDAAIKNALTLWVTSKKGEFLYAPRSGGILDPLLFKNMDPNKLQMILFGIKNDIVTAFTPAINLVGLDVKPDYENRLLEISIQYASKTTGQIEEVLIYTKNIYSITEQEFQDVTFTGLNLKTFCLMKKPDMEGKILSYDENNLKWQWGIYTFSNLTEADPYFSEILAICNG